MKTLATPKRVRDLIYIANRLIRFASEYSFDGPDREMKSELYAKAYMLYNIAFFSLSKIKMEISLYPHMHCMSFSKYTTISHHSQKEDFPLLQKCTE